MPKKNDDNRNSLGCGFRRMARGSMFPIFIQNDPNLKDCIFEKKLLKIELEFGK